MAKTLIHVTRTRVRYAETDQAGVIYHSNYLIYFEIGRTDLLRNLGFPYRRVEDELGVVLAVVDCQAKFRAPGRYDDPLRVETTLTSIKGTRIHFEYAIVREDDGVTLCTGSTVLAAVKNGRAVRVPEELARVCGFEDN